MPFKFRSLSWTTSSSSSASSSSSDSPPTPPPPPVTSSPMAIAIAVPTSSEEGDPYNHLVRFSDACVLIPRQNKVRRSASTSVSPSKSCFYAHHRRHVSVEKPPDPPVVRSPPSSPRPSVLRGRSNSFLASIPFLGGREHDDDELDGGVEVPLRPCCPQCAASFTHPSPKEKFTRGARRRQRSASEDSGCGGFKLVEEKCQLQMGGSPTTLPVTTEEEGEAETNVLDGVPDIRRERGRPPRL